MRAEVSLGSSGRRGWLRVRTAESEVDLTSVSAWQCSDMPVGRLARNAQEFAFESLVRDTGWFMSPEDFVRVCVPACCPFMRVTNNMGGREDWAPLHDRCTVSHLGVPRSGDPRRQIYLSWR